MFTEYPLFQVSKGDQGAWPSRFRIRNQMFALFLVQENTHPVVLAIVPNVAMRVLMNLIVDLGIGRTYLTYLLLGMIYILHMMHRYIYIYLFDLQLLQLPKTNKPTTPIAKTVGFLYGSDRLESFC